MPKTNQDLLAEFGLRMTYGNGVGVLTHTETGTEAGRYSLATRTLTMTLYEDETFKDVPVTQITHKACQYMDRQQKANANCSELLVDTFRDGKSESGGTADAVRVTAKTGYGCLVLDITDREIVLTAQDGDGKAVRKVTYNLRKMIDPHGRLQHDPE